LFLGAEDRLGGGVVLENGPAARGVLSRGLSLRQSSSLFSPSGDGASDRLRGFDGVGPSIGAAPLTKEAAEQLEEVQTAITNCLSAQSVGIGDKSMMRARLDFLQKREDVLLRRYKEESATGSAAGMFNKVEFNDAA
jgi:hypothetical protein